MQASKLARFVAAGTLAFVVSLPAFAQAPAAPGQPGQGQGRGQGRRGQRGVSLATIPVDALDSAVKLKADQRTKIQAIQDKLRTDSQALRPQPGSPPDPANRDKMREMNQKAIADIEAILTTEQKDKLKTAMAEMGTLRSVGIPLALAGSLKLTDDQKKKIADISKEIREKMQNGGQGADRRALMQEGRTKVEAILTAEQKAAIEKYNKEHPRGQGRGQRPPRTDA
jgi:Spy/CpxP family protein refolding chaperone